jgi:hypothetical protein
MSYQVLLFIHILRPPLLSAVRRHPADRHLVGRRSLDASGHRCSERRRHRLDRRGAHHWRLDQRQGLLLLRLVLLLQLLLLLLLLLLGKV